MVNSMAAAMRVDAARAVPRSKPSTASSSKAIRERGNDTHDRQEEKRRVSLPPVLVDPLALHAHTERGIIESSSRLLTVTRDIR